MDKQNKKIYIISSVVVSFLCLLMLVYYSHLPVEISANAMEQNDIVSNNEATKVTDLDKESEKAEAENQWQEEKAEVNAENQTDLSTYENIAILDAGHGGLDIGAQAVLGMKYSSRENGQEPNTQDEKRIDEKDLTLEIAKRVGSELTGKQFEVKYTRLDDKQISIKDRSMFVKEEKARFTISIHADANADRVRQGVEVYFNEKAQNLLNEQETIQQQIVQTLSEYTNEKVTVLEHATGDGVLIYDIDSPAIQINLGNLANVQDGKMLAREDYRKRLVKGITEAVLLLIDES